MSDQVSEASIVRAAPMTPSRKRLLLAFLVTPMLPGFYGALLFGQPWAFPIGLAVAYPMALVLGMPIVVLMCRSQRLQWWTFVAAGIVCAVPALVGYAWLRDVPHLQPYDLLNGLVVLAWGAFSGACFWLIGVAGDTPLRMRDIFDAGPPTG